MDEQESQKRTEEEYNPRLPIEMLPPFSVALTDYGPPHIEVGARRQVKLWECEACELWGDDCDDDECEHREYEWWAIRNRDAEEEVRASLDLIVQSFRGDVKTPPQELEEELRGKVQFALSHAVNTGLYVKVEPGAMERLSKLEGNKSAADLVSDGGEVKPLFSGSPTEVHKIVCPKCAADVDQITLMAPTVIASYYDSLRVEDGAIRVGGVGGVATPSREENIDTSLPPHFECRACEHSWHVPEWIVKRILWS